jgi:hypothetical protein
MCEFPAAELAAYSRRLAREADQIPEERVGDIRLRTQAVLAIQQLRLAHEDIDECLCWYRAIGQHEAPTLQRPA